MENNELQHHGIKGQKWGIRRYQNKDGTLTPRGKKRYAAEMEKLKKEEQVLKNRQKTQAKIDRLLKKEQELEDLKKKVSGKGVDSDDNSKKSSKESDSNKPKSVKDMTDEELVSKINRMRLEQTYTQLMPKEISKGEKFLDQVLKPMGKKTADTLTNVAVDKLNKNLRKHLGLSEDEMSSLKKAAEKAGYEMRIRANQRDKNKDKKDEPRESKTEPESDSDKETVTGEVHGTSSKRKDTSSSRSSDYYDPIYTDFVDKTPYSDDVASYRSAGQTVIDDYLSSPAGLLSLPAPKKKKK